MLSQAEKISQVTHQLNVYLEEIGTTEILTEAHVNNEVDSSEAKGRKLYKKYFKKTQLAPGMIMAGILIL